MQNCPQCGAATDEQRHLFGGMLHCPACGKSFAPSVGDEIVSAEMGTALPAALPPAPAPPVTSGPAKPPIVAPAFNPFSDAAGGPYAGPYGGPAMPFWQPDPTRALAKVQTPATILQIYGGLVCVAALLMAAAIPLVMMAEPGEDEFGAIVMCAIGAPCSLVIGPLTIWAGVRMKKLQSYKFAQAMVVVNLIFAILVCPIFLLASIWPLIVLQDGEVKACFKKPDGKP